LISQKIKKYSLFVIAVGQDLANHLVRADLVRYPAEAFAEHADLTAQAKAL
jgi:hypothetical protein